MALMLRLTDTMLFQGQRALNTWYPETCISKRSFQPPMHGLMTIPIFGGILFQERQFEAYDPIQVLDNLKWTLSGTG